MSLGKIFSGKSIFLDESIFFWMREHFELKEREWESTGFREYNGLKHETYANLK